MLGGNQSSFSLSLPNYKEVRMEIVGALVKSSDGLWLIEADGCDSERTIKEFIKNYGNGHFQDFIRLLEFPRRKSESDDEFGDKANKLAEKEALEEFKKIFKKTGEFKNSPIEVGSRAARCIGAK